MGTLLIEKGKFKILADGKNDVIDYIKDNNLEEGFDIHKHESGEYVIGRDDFWDGEDGRRLTVLYPREDHICLVEFLEYDFIEEEDDIDIECISKDTYSFRLVGHPLEDVWDNDNGDYESHPMGNLAECLENRMSNWRKFMNSKD